MKRITISFVMLFSTIFYLSCSTTSFTGVDNLLEDYGISKIPMAEDFPDDDAVMILNRHDVKVEITGAYDVVTEETIHRLVKLFKNIEDHAFVQIHLNDGEKLDKIIARTIKTDGTIVNLKDDDFYTISGEGGGSVFYSDKKSVRFTFAAIEKNCMIEYEFIVKKDYPFVYDVWDIQRYIPTLRNEYHLTVPSMLIRGKSYGGAGWDWRYRTYNYDIGDPIMEKNLNPTQTTREASYTFSWKLRNIPSFKPDPVMPHHSNYLSYVRFAPSDWKEWSDISKWYYNKVFKTELVITDKIKEKAEELTKNDTGDKVKIETIFQYIQGLRYVAIALGDGNIRPAKPQTVMEREYGDCKDKSILLISLLRSLDISAKPVLVLTSNRGSFDDGFPSWRFNHMIVKVETGEGEVLWIDPTVCYYRLGEIPWQCEGIKVLVLNDDGTAQIETTPASSFIKNITDINIAVDLASEEEALFNVTICYKGKNNFKYRNYLSDLSDEKIKEFCKEQVVDEYLNAQIIEYTFSDLDSINSDLLFNFTFTVPNALQQQGDLYFLNIDPFKLLTDMSWLSKDERNYPIEYNYPFRITKNIEIILPEERFSVRNLPERIYLKDEGMSYEKTFTQSEPNIILANERLDIKSKYISPRQYPQFRECFDKIKNKSSEKLILNKL